MSTEAVLQNSTRAVGGVPQKPPVLGGSGRQYWTIRDALAGEAALAVTVASVVPQAGTGPGVVVFQAGQSAVNNFYKDRYILNTDTTPTNGLVAQWMRISDYVGATRTATGDKPWDFSAESDVSIIQPARISLQGDVTEDATITIPLELDLQGHRIQGKVDVTGGGFLWIRGGSGYITNGIQKTDFGLLKVDDCAVSRRDATIYALLMTNGSDLGLVELSNCRFSGVVAGRRGFASWKIYDCSNYGVVDSTINLNVPYRLIESVGAVAITLSQFILMIDSPLSGAFFYSENSISNATAYFQVDGRMSVETTGHTLTEVKDLKSFAMAMAVGAGIFNVTASSGEFELQVDGGALNVDVAINTNPDTRWSILWARNLTGTLSFLVTGFELEVEFAGPYRFCGILVSGAADCSGAVTLGGASLKRINCLGCSFSCVELASRLTGSVTISGGSWSGTTHQGVFTWIEFQAAQNAGAPTLTISAQITRTSGSGNFGIIGTISGGGLDVFAVTVGTWTFSGVIVVKHCFTQDLLRLGTQVSGGTWIASGRCDLTEVVSATQTTLLLWTHNGTGGTLTISGNLNYSGGAGNNFRIAGATGAGSNLTVSSATLSLSYTRFVAASTMFNATTATSTLSVSSAVVWSYSRFEAAWTVLNSSPGGANVSAGPSSIIFEYCVFTAALTIQTGAGTITWAGATLRFRHCHVEGLYTVVYTTFTTHEAYHSRFNGGSSNKSIAGSGTRPTTLRYWACTAAQRYDDILPEWISVYDVLPAQAALVQGQPVKINAANQYQVCVAASIVDGVLLAAAGAAGTFAVNVRQGRVFVAAKAATANGDNLALDLATPTQTNIAPFTPGQNVGTALEAVGTTVAGKSYAAVNVR